VSAGPVADAFAAAYGTAPEGVWQAPGRATLVGEHTDYNQGLAITFAIDRCTLVAARRRADGRVRVRSTAEPGVPPGARLADLAPGRVRGWPAYPLGALWALGRAGAPVPGLDLLVHSTVPVGRGLSSSAALTMAVAAAALDLGGGEADLVAACQQAENAFVGAPTGLMDQLTLARAQPGRALLIDFQSLTVELLPLDVGPLVVVDTGVSHRNDDGTYAERRQACEAAAAVLGVASLRAVATTDALGTLTGTLGRRARHVVTENERVRHAAGLLRATPADRGTLGAVLDASHRSLRDDYEVSWPEADATVDAARDAGAAGARMVGAGGGGCCLALGAPAGAVAGAVRRALGPGPSAFAVAPGGGAGRLA
jgi:galactokinase